MIDGEEPQATVRDVRRGWDNFIKYLIIILVAEKVIQHIVVTVAFYLNLNNIASTVAVNPGTLMVVGAVLAVLFALSLWGMLSRRGWAINLIILLAACDILGEFVAQGRLDIVITVSFTVATILFFLAGAYRKRTQRILVG